MGKISKAKVFIFSFLTLVCTGIAWLSGLLDNLNKLPESYEQLKKNYLYDSVFLSGNWSTNSEYVANSADLGLDAQQPIIVMSMAADDDGSITGEIMSEKICDALPLTWHINFQSNSPSWINLVKDREFNITQLHNGETETVATLKLDSKNEKFGSITFNVVSDKTGILPSSITFGKDLPEYESDYKKLQAYCGDSPRKFWSSPQGKEILKSIRQ